MSRARDLADLLDTSGDVKSAALDNVPASNDASALTTGTLPAARLPSSGVDASALTTGTLNAARLPSSGIDASSLTTGTLNNARLASTVSVDKVQVESAGGGDFVAKFQNETAATPYGVWIKEPVSAANGYPSLNITDNAGTGTRFRVDSGTGKIYAPGDWADAPAGTSINTQLYTNSTYVSVANSNTWTNVWSFSYTPKLNGSKLFLNFSVNVLPEGSNGHNFWLGMYNNSGHTGTVLGQQYWYEISRAAGNTGWTQDQHIMQTQFNTSLGQGNAAYFLLQFQNGTATGTSYFNYSNAFSSLIITEVAS